MASEVFKHEDTLKAYSRAMVAPVVRDCISGKYAWREARKVMCIYKEPVPQTDTGRQEENSKANGRKVVKELGKLTP